MALSNCDYCRGWFIPHGSQCPKCGRAGEHGINPGVSVAEAVNSLRDLSASLTMPGDYRAKLPPERPSFDATFMEIAGVVAKRGTCPRLQVGSVITVDNRIIATGYNGSPAGLPHCSEVGCLFEKCPVCQGRGTREAYPMAPTAIRCGYCGGKGEAGGCKRTTHAEANALIQCARMGASPEGGRIYVTHRPCVNCAGLIITAGITAVIYAGDYKTDGLEDPVTRMFMAAGIELEKWSQ